MDARSLDGRGYARFLAAGSYFLKKYRSVLNDLNVYPVPDGDTGTNMYLTLRSAARSAYASGRAPISSVAAAAAHGGLTGARGNSGVILSQMLRGFAHHVRHRATIDGFVAATALREAALAARQALLAPSEGTILSVADAAAESAYRLALHEPDLVRVLSGIVRFANEALERTPEELPALQEAGVVDAGGAGLVYLLEGALAFLPDVKARATAFPRRPVRGEVFSRKQRVGVMRYCTELVLENATCTPPDLRKALEPRGESLIVAGASPTLKVHVHTDDPEHVKAIASRFGEPTRFKIDDMAQQHRMLVVPPPETARSIVAAVPGPGFETIAKELGAEVTLSTNGDPSVAEFALAINNALADEVWLLPGDANAMGAARGAAAMSGKRVRLLETRNVVEAINALLALRAGETDLESIERSAGLAPSARIFLSKGRPAAVLRERSFAGESIPAVARAAAAALADGGNGLLTLYYGGGQREKDARHLSEELTSAFARIDVEYYYGGMKNAEYWVAFDD
ncbi:MAG: DAK2 domain-containing protein [Candidatus Tyrphobacter sp.]